jgi:hypothetical protein
LENDEVGPVEILRAAARAALGRTVGMPFFFAPGDGSTVTLTDLTGKKAARLYDRDAQGQSHRPLRVCEGSADCCPKTARKSRPHLA